MAAPRVFISSTCYDLVDERDSLAEFCSGFGFDAALSERGDIFYHPDLHTHTSCVRETATCQLFVLIIGGRFGGKYVVDKSKSITNAEYSAAREQGLPIFTFVKQDVLNDHNIWQRNKGQPFVADITYPSIERQEHAIEIFNFIDQVRSTPTNNGFFGFRFTKDILEFLRKQWASMFYEYLQARSLSRQLATTNETLASLAAASDKIEEIVRNIYRNVDAAGADESLTAIDLDSRARELFLTIATRTGDKQFLYNNRDADYVPPESWITFFTSEGFFALKENKEDDGSISTSLHYDIEDIVIAKIEGKLNKLQQAEISYFAQGYEAFRKLPLEARQKIMQDYVFIPPKNSPKSGSK